MAYIEIEKRRFGRAMPNDVVRVSKATLTLSPNIAETFQATRYTTESGRDSVKLGIAVDMETQRIKLLPTSINGYSWANVTNGNSLYVQKPAGFRKLELPTGDYQLVNSRTLEFELAR